MAFPEPKPTNNDAYNDSTWWYNKGWNDCLAEMKKWLDKGGK